MTIYLIGVLYNQSKKITGFRLLDIDTGQVLNTTYDAVLGVLKSKNQPINGIELTNNTLKGSNGSFERYPTIIDNIEPGNSPLIVINEIDDVAYTVSDLKGLMVAATVSDVITYAKRFGISNGKVITKNGTEYISAISGTYKHMDIPSCGLEVTSLFTGKKEKIKKCKQINKENQAETKAKPEIATKTEIKPTSEIKAENRRTVIEDMMNRLDSHSDSVLPPIIAGLVPPVSSNKLIDEKTGLTVEQKLVKSFLLLQSLEPFYYAILATLKKVETSDIPTMGVSTDTLFYNPEFVKELEISELLFIDIHEVMHIAMQHKMRKGHRIHSLWNRACDLFINKLICEEYSMDPDSMSAVVEKNMKKIPIRFLSGGLYSNKINTKTDTAEGIYEVLLKSYNEELSKAMNNSSGQSDQSNQSGSGSQGNDDQQSNGSESEGSQNGKSEQDGSENNEQNGGSGSEGSKGKKKEGSDKGKNGGNTSGKVSIGSVAKAMSKVNYKGDIVGADCEIDIVESAEESESTDAQKSAKARAVLERASVMSRQMKGTFGGEAGCSLERIVEEALAPKVDWRSLLKNKLIKASQTVTTFSKPDKRFLSRNRILPGPKPLENDSLDNVKVCIDTSGSISDEDLGIALAQIAQMFRVYKVTAEVLYWDTQIRNVAPFKNVQELLRIKPAGGGGTDVNCVFEYFEGGLYKRGMKPKPSVIIIFTDGYFPEVEKRYCKYKDTIWIINGDYKFKPPFGVQAKLKY